MSIISLCVSTNNLKLVQDHRGRVDALLEEHRDAMKKVKVQSQVSVKVTKEKKNVTLD